VAFLLHFVILVHTFTYSSKLLLLSSRIITLIDMENLRLKRSKITILYKQITYNPRKTRLGQYRTDMSVFD